ncbi:MULTISPECIES: DUF5777 family beta-barrel protein [unclassified Flavobacterium]|uniref:DUF5777 family beta-barrel protein n=1 Tax=unclassified Flavobacterium TaxID=196869 RepID=UPI000EAF6E0A|nr:MULTISPECIES: DUF5777 family beta-barrel protein [unclassified Flavobacterium]RKS01630.1 hypothetical protein C8C84_1307 [Flavobacterium sp. 102]
MIKFFLKATLVLFVLQGYSQSDLLAEFDTVSKKPSYATATFKGLQIVTLQSTKMPAKQEFYFVVSHRFGSVRGGISEFFGFDGATTKIGGVYGATDWLSVSGSRHTLLKVYEAGLKYRVMRQGDQLPFDIVGYNTLDVNSFLRKEEYPGLEFSHRLTYINQILVSRKFSEKLSLEIASSFIHKNVYSPIIENDNQFTVGAGGRMKITKRLSLTFEYLNNFNLPDYYQNPLSVGLDVETGGHIFQLIFTNSQAMTESGYLTAASGNWEKGEVFFGFNLYRVF